VAVMLRAVAMKEIAKNTILLILLAGLFSF
jgi:hypothetical protein